MSVCPKFLNIVKVGGEVKRERQEGLGSFSLRMPYDFTTT